MSKTATKRIVVSIIRMRKQLLNNHQSGKNAMSCYATIKELQLQIEAYGNKWTEEGWKAFAKRNIDKLIFLIPGNKSGETIKQKLYEAL